VVCIGRALDAIASRLGLSDVDADCENYWEWVIGTLPGHEIQLDITRTHQVPASETDTRIFVWEGPDGRLFSDPIIELIARRLRDGGISPVHAGRWDYRSPLIRQSAAHTMPRIPVADARARRA
jgi:hypothetical protein